MAKNADVKKLKFFRSIGMKFLLSKIYILQSGWENKYIFFIIKSLLEKSIYQIVYTFNFFLFIFFFEDHISSCRPKRLLCVRTEKGATW